MILEGILQFLAAAVGNRSFFRLVFRTQRALSPLRIYRRDRLADLLDLCKRLGYRSHYRKFCGYRVYHSGFQDRKHSEKMSGNPVSYCGDLPGSAGDRNLQDIYYTLLENNDLSLHYGRETLGIAIAIVLGIIFVFEIPQKTINRAFQKKA